MKNNEIFDYLESISGTRIWKLVWIAGDPHREDVEEIIDSMLDDGSFEGNFPDIPIDATKHCTQFGDLEQLLMNHNKFGFLAQVHFPSLETFNSMMQGTLNIGKPGLCVRFDTYMSRLSKS